MGGVSRGAQPLLTSLVEKYAKTATYCSFGFATIFLEFLGHVT